MKPDDPDVLAHNAAVVARNIQREEDAKEHFECPVCHDKRSAEEGSVCSSCCYSHLRRFGWNI